MIYLILFLGFILRLVSLNQSFWLDEATSANVVRDFGFKEIITKFSPGDFHPPLYYLILKVWSQTFGLNEVSARMLSIIAALGTIYLIYLIGREIFNKKLGIFGAILLATSPLHIYYSQEARMYSLATFFVTLAIFSFVKTIKEGRVGYWFAFALSITLAAATDYVPVLILPVFWVFGIISKQNRSWWKKFLASHIILVLAAVWWFPTFWQQLTAGLGVATSLSGWWKVLGPTSFKNLILIPVKFMIGRISFDDKNLYVLIVSSLTLLFSFLVYKARKSSKLIWLWLIIPITLGILLSFWIPTLSYFRYLFILPAFYLLIAGGIEKTGNMKRMFLILVLAVNLLSTIYYLLNPKFHREDWRGLVGTLNTRQDAVVVFPAKSQREAFNYYHTKIPIIEIENLGKDKKEIWLMRYVYEIFDPEDKTRLRIENLGYSRQAEYNFNGVVVWRYQR